MSRDEFSLFVEKLLGTWSGTRDGEVFAGESVRSTWAMAFGGNVLAESWQTSGGGSTLNQTAFAYFSLVNDQPPGFVVVYENGRIGHGPFDFGNGEWSILHRWLGGHDEAEIRVRLTDNDTYEQEVFETDERGARRLVSRAVLTREPTRPTLS